MSHKRERIHHMRAAGMSISKIARTLEMSESGVRFHFRNSDFVARRREHSRRWYQINRAAALLGRKLGVPVTEARLQLAAIAAKENKKKW